MIRGVVFDYGGVLARHPRETDFRPIAEEIGLKWEMYLAGAAKYRRAYDGDLITCEEMYRRVAAENGLVMTEGQLQRLCAADDGSWIHPIPETLAWMRELKAGGYRIGILTNMAEKFFDGPVSAVFAEHIAIADAVVVSGKENVTKPDAPIYRLMEKRIGLAPDELLFFDDNLCNVDGATACGWRSAVFSGIAGARQVLAQLLV